MLSRGVVGIGRSCFVTRLWYGVNFNHASRAQMAHQRPRRGVRNRNCSKKLKDRGPPRLGASGPARSGRVWVFWTDAERTRSIASVVAEPEAKRVHAPFRITSDPRGKTRSSVESTPPTLRTLKSDFIQSRVSRCTARFKISCALVFTVGTSDNVFKPRNDPRSSHAQRRVSQQAPRVFDDHVGFQASSLFGASVVISCGTEQLSIAGRLPHRSTGQHHIAYVFSEQMHVVA